VQELLSLGQVTGTCVWLHDPASHPALKHALPVSVQGVLSGSLM